MQVLEAYRMFANSRGWRRRMEEDIARGLSAAAAVEKEQTATRAADGARCPTPTCANGCTISTICRTGCCASSPARAARPAPRCPTIRSSIASNIGPGELLEYGRRKLKGIVLEEGSVASHAAIVARAWAIPLIVHAGAVTSEALNGDLILVDGEHGIVHLRPEDAVVAVLPRQDGDGGGAAGTLRVACATSRPKPPTACASG